MQVQRIKDRLQLLNRKLTELEVEKTLREKELEDLKKEMVFLLSEQALLSKTEAVLSMISTAVLGKSTSTIDQLVTAGLRAIFEDQDLLFQTKVERYRGRTAVQFKLLERGIEHPLIDSYGGGVLAVVGVLLRVVTIITLNLRRVLILDEALSHVSDQYIQNTSSFLKELCEKMGFTILMVSHQPEFAAAANIHYQVARKKDKLVLMSKREAKNGA